MEIPIYFRHTPLLISVCSGDISLTMRYDQVIKRFEKYYFWMALDRNGWKIPAAAADVGMTREGLWAITKRYGLRPGRRPSDPIFLVGQKGIKKVRRVILLDPMDLAWLKSKGYLGSYGQLVRAGLRTLKRLPDSRIRELL